MYSLLRRLLHLFYNSCVFADITSDSSVTSVHFDESLTEDEIAEISLRAVVASEGHRRRHRSRGSAPLKKFEERYESLKGLCTFGIIELRRAISLAVVPEGVHSTGLESFQIPCFLCLDLL